MAALMAVIFEADAPPGVPEAFGAAQFMAGTQLAATEPEPEPAEQ